MGLINERMTSVTPNIMRSLGRRLKDDIYTSTLLKNLTLISSRNKPISRLMTIDPQTSLKTIPSKGKPKGAPDKFLE